MRTNIVIDNQLMAEAPQLTGITTKREAVEQALKLMVLLKRQEKARALRGKLSWEGDLGEMRQAR